MGRKEEFLQVFKRAESKYGKSEKRLAAEGWGAGWKVLISTIMSAQSRDETTIKIASALFKRYGGLKALAEARYGDVLRIFKGLNYNKTKAKNVINCARMLVSEYNGKVPESIEELVKLPGVGRKTANLVITEVHKMDGITVDTHVHRICNVFGFVHTKTRDKTEMELREFVPRKYWARINRIFVLWGKEVSARDKKRLLEKLGEE